MKDGIIAVKDLNIPLSFKFQKVEKIEGPVCPICCDCCLCETGGV